MVGIYFCKYLQCLYYNARCSQLYFLLRRTQFVIYLFFLTFITTAFVLGATKAGSPSEYSQPIDWFRLFCEIVVFLLITIDILFEINQF